MRRRAITFTVLIGGLCHASSAQVEVQDRSAVPREVLALTSTKQDDRSKGIVDHVHEFLELPLNHLGLVVRSRRFRDGEPGDVDPTKVRAILTFFRGTEECPDWLWPWLHRQAKHPALRFVHMGSLQPLGRSTGPGGGAARLQTWLARFGLDWVESVVEDPLRVKLQLQERCCFEARPVFTRAHLGLRSRSAHNDPWLATTLRDDAGDESHPVVTGPWGGVALDPYIFRIATTDDEFRWFIDPFRFFRDALGMRHVPAPDPCVLFGRRMFLFHVDGDGFESVSTVVHGKVSAQVFRKRIIERFRIPMTISVIVRSVTTDLRVPVPTHHMQMAREILALPWVEAASHTVLHPLNWRRRLTPRSLPRSVVWYPELDNYRHSMLAEVRDSIRFINRNLLEPGKTCRVLLWSGGANPREDAILECARQGAWNLNGGTFRWDADTNSVGFVSPWGRRVGRAYQVYCGAANENDFDGFYTTMPRAFGHIDETLERTGRDRILKPANVYVHFYSAERPARLAALQGLLEKWVHYKPTIPVHASTYASAVHSAHEQCRVEAIPGGWAFSDFGRCRCVRIDGESRAIDWVQSRGLAGARRMAGSLFLQLAGSDAEVVFGNGATRRPHIEQSDHLLAAVALLGDGLSCRSEGYRHRQFVVAGIPPHGELRVSIGRETHEGQADSDGRYRVVIRRASSVDVRVRVR